MCFCRIFTSFRSASLRRCKSSLFATVCFGYQLLTPSQYLPCSVQLTRRGTTRYCVLLSVSLTLDVGSCTECLRYEIDCAQRRRWASWRQHSSSLFSGTSRLASSSRSSSHSYLLSAVRRARVLQSSCVADAYIHDDPSAHYMIDRDVYQTRTHGNQSVKTRRRRRMSRAY
jgi:hypothetical protein